MPIDQTVVTITPEAVEAILGIRSQEPDAGELALSLAITGINGVEFAYELTFIPIADAGDEDALAHHDGLPVVVAAASIGDLTGATIEVRDGGLAIDNPNSPLPDFDLDEATLEGDLAAKVQTLLDFQINPAIASHGGSAELAGVEDLSLIHI